MNLLVIVLSSQLLYYLLIAQTGIVGVFHSRIDELFTLPIGGVLGGLFSAYWRHPSIKMELCFLFGIQMIVSWFYPEYSLGMLLILGFVIGYTTPLLLYVFGSQSSFQLAIGMAMAYAAGSALYTYPFAQRGEIAILLPLLSVIALRFSLLKLPSIENTRQLGIGSIGIMMLWIFADSALFETLSRSGGMDIWSDYPLLIIAAHLIGVYLAYRYGRELRLRTKEIWGLFVLSYALYWMHQPVLLAIVYPIGISYYNVLLFQALIRTGDIRTIALSMIAIGWVAASAASAIALSHHLWVAAGLLGVFGMIYPFYRRIM